MKKLIAIAAVLLSTAAVAQPDKDWWACQVVHSSGMNWENNRWVTTTFKDDPPFVLMSDGNGSLTRESVLKAVDSSGLPLGTIECRDWGYRGQVTCMVVNGHSLSFNKETGKGGFSKTFGATTLNTDYRDSVTVRAFECTKG